MAASDNLTAPKALTPLKARCVEDNLQGIFDEEFCQSLSIKCKLLNK